MEPYEYTYYPHLGRHITTQYIVVKPDLEPEDNQLFINVEMEGALKGDAWISIAGKDEVEKFVYAAAVAGGLIEEGEELRLNG